MVSINAKFAFKFPILTNFSCSCLYRIFVSISWECVATILLHDNEIEQINENFEQRFIQECKMGSLLIPSTWPVIVFVVGSHVLQILPIFVATQISC